MKSAVFWAVIQWWNVDGSGCFGNSCWSHLHRLNDQRRMPSNRSASGHLWTGVDGDRFLATRTKVNTIWSLHFRRKDSKIRSLLAYLLNYVLNPWSRVIFEKLTGLELVKKFPAFYGTQRFINTFTSACHLFLSWASSIQSMPQHLTPWRYKAESNENLKSVITFWNTAKLSCKLATVILIVWRGANRWQYDGGMQHDGAALV